MMTEHCEFVEQLLAVSNPKPVGTLMLTRGVALVSTMTGT
jgi:hypothetical protein